MKRSIVVGLCLLAFSASGQVNLIDTLRLDTLGSSCTYGAETSHKYVFNSNYVRSLYDKGIALIALDKITFQKTIFHHFNSFDTARYINYLFTKGDTIRTIENAYYFDTSCSCHTVRILSNRYDENLNLLQSKTLDILKNDTSGEILNLLAANNDKHLCMSATKVRNSSYTGIFWIFDLNSDSALFSRKRLTPYIDSGRIETVHFISVNDSGDFIISGLKLGDFSMNGPGIIKLLANDNYSRHLYYSPRGYDTLNYEAMFLWAHNFVTEKNHYYYSTAQGNCQQDSTATTNGYFTMTIPFLKSYAVDSFLIPFHGVCAPADTTPNLSGITHDEQVPTAIHPIRFINDHVFVDIHPTHADLNDFLYYNPCQPYTGRMEIVYWDTALNVVKRTWIQNLNENFYINGFFQTQQKDLMVYGHMCALGHPSDSIHLFAFLLDKNSGHLLSIFNAQDFTAQNEYEVFPNPFDEQLNIKRPVAKEETLYLYDNTGKLVLTKPLFSEKENIFTGNLPAGLYFYNIYGKDGVRKDWGKVVKE
jgi:hypothetical protein